MSDNTMFMIEDDGEATLYDDTYDIVVHCVSKEEQDEARRLLENVPHWIHVSEQLPEEEVDVLCVTHAGAMFVASYGQLYFDPNEKGWITTEFNRFCTGTVYAWTNLPEKPKGVTI